MIAAPSARSVAAPEGGAPEGPREGRTHAVLFDADGSDHEVAVDRIDLASLSERQLLWIDHEGEQAAPLLQRLGLGEAVAALDGNDGRPRLQNFDGWFLMRVVAVAAGDRMECPHQSLAVISGRNFVVTLHRRPLEFLAQLREREQGETRIGVLSAESFTAALLDWQMSTYFEAVAALEAEVDRLEVQLLDRPHTRGYVSDLAVLRRAASKLRRLLAPHRQVYGAMARPDFRPEASEATQKHFRALNERFERTLDAVEAARELVIGSFELFATHTAQRTNEIMRTLTFVTVLLGTLAVIAGVLGMNFEAPIFKTGTRGFIGTILSMGALSLLAMFLAHRRRWW